MFPWVAMLRPHGPDSTALEFSLGFLLVAEAITAHYLVITHDTLYVSGTPTHFYHTEAIHYYSLGKSRYKDSMMTLLKSIKLVVS